MQDGKPRQKSRHILNPVESDNLGKNLTLSRCPAAAIEPPHLAQRNGSMLGRKRVLVVTGNRRRLAWLSVPISAMICAATSRTCA